MSIPAMRNGQYDLTLALQAVLTFALWLLPVACQPRPELPSAMPPTETPGPTGELIIVNGTIIDAAGGAPIPDGAVVIAGDSIEAVGPQSELEIPSHAEVLDAQGGTILPGIIDAHTHGLEQVALGNGDLHATDRIDLAGALQAGVTTIRDLGSPYGASEDLPALRALLQSAGNTVPHIVVAGPILSAPAGPMIGCCSRQAIEVADAEAAAEATARLLADGADGIKIVLETGGNVRDDVPRDLAPSLSLEQIQAIVRVAHAEGVRVTAHVSDAVEAQTAITGGVDELAHWPFAGSEMTDDMVRQLVEQEIPIVSTFLVFKPDPGELRRFLDAGGVIALGTDAPGVTTLGMPYSEILAMRLAGMEPMEIIMAATSHAAMAVGLGDTVGTLEQGKRADIIAVAGDPLAELKVLRDVVIVIKRGEVIRRP